MKERRTADFVVTIVDESQQHETSPELYDGIYSVHCNHAVVGVAFVPEFRTGTNWPPTVDIADSLDWDAPPDACAARWITAVTSSIVVTPHDGPIRVESFDTDRSMLVISVPRGLFARLVDEARTLLDTDDRIRWRAFGGGGVRISELELTDIVRFLRAYVLTPAILSPAQLHLLALD